MRLGFIFICSMALLSFACAPGPAEDGGAGGADIAAVVDGYLDRYFELYPSRATEAGLHDRDRELEDLSAERLSEWVAFNRETAGRLEEALADPQALDQESALNAELLLRQARRELFAYETAERHRTQPLFWTGIASGTNVFLLVRDDVPAAERLEAAAARAELIPRLVDQALATLALDEPGRIAPEHARIAAGQAAASATFYRQGFAGAAGDDEGGDGGEPDDLEPTRAAMAEAGEKAAAALDRLSEALSDLAERATGSPRLGPERYAELFALVNGTDEPVEAVLARAREALAAKRAETAGYGREVWDDLFPGEEPPADDRELILRLFDRVADDRVSEVEPFVTDYRHLLEQAYVFVQEHQVITLPGRRTIWVGTSPSYFVGQSVGGVYPAGPYAPDADTLFYLPTPPADATAEEKDAFFRDFNHHFNVMITPHEIVPGHYTQLKIAAHQPHKVRALFPDGVYTEGWGTFSERLMLDLGWGRPLDRLAHLKKQLENIARTIVDIRVHTEGVERDEVIRFVREEALQDDQFARNMWVRSITSAPQITSYWLGYEQVMGLYEDVLSARGDGFVLKEFMDGMMAMGPVPVRHYREAMLGE